LLKGVPKSHIYRILRGGEVRVNSGRVAPDYRICAGDRVRIPPVRVARKAGGTPRDAPALHVPVLFEDEVLLVVNKPAGLAVHGGSGVSFGVIERLRQSRQELRFLELVHRLDRDTSGVLMLAKKRSALTALHAELRAGSVRKFYLTLVRGSWQGAATRDVELPLHKHLLSSGERRVSIREGGMPSHTRIRLRKRLGDFSFLEAELKTGRTHQIRVHLAHLGFPIAGDDKYGDFVLNKQLARQGLKRMFLHACKTVIEHPGTGNKVTFEAPLPADLENFLNRPGLQSG
jgi:23S rRNA pseudouridine955/2504/2580 synthase